MTSDQEKEIRAVCLETRKFEIELLWKRAEFFSVFVGAALVAYSVFRKEDPTAALAIACFGMFASLVWTLANAGSKWWQHHWEIKTKAAFGFAPTLFSEVIAIPERNWLYPVRRFSVSKLLMIFSGYVSLLWMGLVAREVARLAPLASYFPMLWDLRYIVLLVVTAGFMIVALVKGRGED